MTIQWFPGHMTKARRQIEEKLKLIDIVFELVDARLPLSSRNPMIDEILQHKPRLVLLNKSDLADADITKEWLDFFARRDLHAHSIDAAQGQHVKEIVQKTKLILQDKINAQIRKGMKPRALRALIVGIPNVGKSTLINRLAGRNIAATGDKPGVTKGQQWIKMGKDLELLDTPGILWPKFDDPNVGYRLAVTGAIKETILPTADVAFYATKFLLLQYPQRLKDRYGLEQLPADPEVAEQVVETMEAIGRKRGCLQSGGRIDLEKASLLILRELRAGMLGRISLERPQ